MRKISFFIIGLVILLGTFIGLGFYIQSLNNDLEKAQAKVELLQKWQKLSQEAEIKAMAARQVENEKAKERERIMQNVLDEHCDWSGIELPDDVSKLLRCNKTGASGVCSPSYSFR